MKKRILLFLSLFIVGVLLVSCGGGKNDPSDTDGLTDSASASESLEESSGDSGDPAESAGESTNESDASGESDTAGETTPETQPQIEVDGVRMDSRRITTLFSGSNALTVTREELEDEGYVVKLTSTAASDDPQVYFNFGDYCKALDVEPFMAENYDYVLLRVKNEGCSSGLFELFYCAGAVTSVNGAYVTSGGFDNSIGDWQYIVFDFSDAPGWEGTVNGFRFDYQQRTTGAGEILYISDILFVKDEDELNAFVRGDMEDPFAYETDPAVESVVEALLATADKAPVADNQKQNATYEDANLDLWFNHAYTKTPAEDITSTGWNTYTMRMAKNEAEGVHLLLASKTGHSGLSVSVTDFKNAANQTLKTELMYGYYFEDVDGLTVVDPIPWVADGQTFDLEAGRSYMYIIKATTAMDSPAGLYSATVTIRDAAGKEIKTATVHAYVWNFVLPEETSCKTQMDLSWANIYVAHEQYEGDDSQLYKNYYDLLLANRVCAYSLPYNNAYAPGDVELYADERILEYLNNPRVVAFNPINWKNHSYNDDTIANAYAFLSQNPEWLEKAYFYIVDEPADQAALDRINSISVQLKEHFPGYKMMAPMHLNYSLNAENTEDYISYVDEAINVWCYKPYFYTTYAQYTYDRSLAYRMSAGIEANLGTFGERMEQEQAEGDELWWYVTRRPEDPEITLLMDTESIRHRILFWQQKLYNVDGFLYYLVNDWYEIGENNGLNKKYEQNGGADGFDCYGNGVLVYCGEDFGVYGGVESIRLENVRDGIEDYEYLTILENEYGKEVTDALIRRLTTSIAHYNTDVDNFTDLRVALGNIIEQIPTADE